MGGCGQATPLQRDPRRGEAAPEYGEAELSAAVREGKAASGVGKEKFSWALLGAVTGSEN